MAAPPYSSYDQFASSSRTSHIHGNYTGSPIGLPGYVQNENPSMYSSFGHQLSPNSWQQNSPTPPTNPHNRSISPSQLSASSSSSVDSNYDPNSDKVLHQALEFTNAIPHPLSIPAPILPQPIILPQTRQGLCQPYLRAYAPCLSPYIDEKTFLAFIDNLNVVTTENPGLGVMGAVGGIIGFVPLASTQIAGMAIEGAAKLGTVAVSVGRQRAFVKEVNERLFKPHGLRVLVVKTPDVRAHLRVPREVPLEETLTRYNLDMTFVDRVMGPLKPYAAPLDVNVPPPEAQRSMLAKLSAMQVASQTKKNDKRELKKREKGLKKSDKKEEKRVKKEDKMEEKRLKKEDKMEGKRLKKEGKRGDEARSPDRKSVEDEREDVGEEDVMKQDEIRIPVKEREKIEKKIHKISWVVVLPL